MASTTLPDYYAILGVPATATPEDVRRAYRVAARRLHPDTNKHPGADVQFRDINTAYEILGETRARADYDMRRNVEYSERAFFSLRLTSSKRILPRFKEAQVLYVLAELTPDPSLVASSEKRTSTPLNLALAVDRSTSMKGHRLERVKAAAGQLINQLGDRDSLAIVSFSDRAEVLLKAGIIGDKQEARSMLMPLQASGGTAIFQGLNAAYEQCMRAKSANSVNHIIMITDGRTYGDEEQCMEMAAQCAREGIGISMMGLGEDWNDTFLDQIAGLTGGYVQYIRSPSEVVTFLNDRVRALSNSIAERVTLSIAPDADIDIEAAFRLSPNPQPISADHDPIPVGQIQVGSSVKILLQLQIPVLEASVDYRSIIRVDVTGDVIREKVNGHKVIADLSLAVEDDPPPQDAPLIIIDALNKLKLFRMQQRAEDALQRGDVAAATHILSAMATQYLAAGEPELADAARNEAARLAHSGVRTQTGGTQIMETGITEEARKRLKYGTRMLLLQASTDPSAGE